MAPIDFEALQAAIQEDLDALPDLEDGGVPVPQEEAAPQPTPEVDGMGTRSIRILTAPAGEVSHFTEIMEVPKAVTTPKAAASSPAGGEEPAPASRLHCSDDNKLGELAPLEDTFCPILPVSKYCYKFIGKKHSETVAEKFFNGGKFWQRTWDLYYVWPTEGCSSQKPLILVSERQVQEFLDEINASFPNIEVKIEDYQREEGLVINFPDHPRCRPRYLGRSTSRDQYDTMAADAPLVTFKPAGEGDVSPPEERTLEAFKQMIEDAIELNKTKKKAEKARKKEARVVQQQNWGRQLKRTQRYLGLRPQRNEAGTGDKPVPPATAQIPAINTAEVAPYSFESSVVFICVDVESYERDHSLITEVGISTLDTLDLVDLPPGKDGENWMSKIRARHFRIKEHAHLNNTEFINGCANRFEFGQSEFIDLAEAPAVVATCFRAPFSGTGAYRADDPSPLLAAVHNPQPAPQPEKRNIILLGHDTNTDVRYLQALGYNPLNLSTLVETLDTVVLHRVYKRDAQPASLARILYEFDITGWHLHNAGNDAYYTMQAMIGIAVRDAANRGNPEVEKARSEAEEEKLQAATNEAIQKVRDDAEGWSSAEEGEDGGAPIAPDNSMPAPVSHGYKPSRANAGRGGPHACGNGYSRGGAMSQEGLQRHDSSFDLPVRAKPKPRVRSRDPGPLTAKGSSYEEDW
ncbi:hypothetical protein H2201_001599 [Coniosporium apollinis]|uniref:Gfd2/YDR514C-like C-terminal domain-containing protein n=1 Tax=Coniosporium apollinis TaxID=61459 RepID=A0ABQ9P3N2_9PEZI|nr:hypothetical protein H2201_001599 [Coniosporium apollinis]